MKPAYVGPSLAVCSLPLQLEFPSLCLFQAVAASGALFPPGAAFSLPLRLCGSLQTAATIAPPFLPSQQYQDAMRAHRAGRKVDFAELPVPPGKWCLA